MRSTSLPIPPRDPRNADTSRFEKDRGPYQALDETYFTVELEPGLGIPVGAAVINAGPPGTEDWPAAAITGRRRTRKLRALWPKTVPRLNVWYTSPGAGAANFTLRFNLLQYDAATADLLVFSVDFPAPGPAVALTKLFATYLAPTPLLPSPRVCQFSLLRIGPDANANAFRLLHAEVVLEERA